ncbi:MAG: hemerythrin domain-containing protein [Microbacterium sp.]
MTQISDAPAWGCRTDDILVAHAVFRRLFSLLPAAVRATDAGDRRHARTIAARIGMASSGLHHHHETEDATLWDTLEERAPACGLHVHLMRAQHARIAVLLDSVDELARWWRADGDPVVRDRLAARLDEVDASLRMHLKDEESKVLPVVQTVMSQLEWDEVGARARSHVDPRYAFAMLGLMLNAGDAAHRAEFEEQVPRIAMTLYRLFGHYQYDRVEADLAPTATSRRAGPLPGIGGGSIATPSPAS